MTPDYVIGLDLGQPHEFTALAVLERSIRGIRALQREDWLYAVPHLHRFLIGTPYTEIVPAVLNLANEPPLRGSTLVVDQTGVGEAIVEMIRRAPRSGALVPVTITAGQVTIQQEDFSFAVPKKDPAAHVQVLLQQRRLKVARSLLDAATLVSELQTFRVKASISTTETVDWRKGAHDDLVLAVALACWWAERSPPWTDDAFGGTGDSVFANPPDGVFAFKDIPESWHDARF